jgi:hypothetical protein
MADIGAAGLLDDMAALRRRTRQDGHAYWLPLLLFGVLILAGSLAYQGKVGYPNYDDPIWHIGGLYVAPLRLFSDVFTAGGDATVTGLYWVAVTVVGALATLGWYRWRAARTGLRIRTRPYLLSVLAGLVIVLVVVPLGSSWTIQLLGDDALGIWVSAAALVVGIVIAVLGRRRVVFLVIGALIAMVAAGNLDTVATLQGRGGLLVIAIGLLGLAWMERSALCGTVAALYTLAALLANLYNMENVFYRLFGFSDNATAAAFDNLLLPGLVLIVGGIVALLTARRTSTPPTVAPAPEAAQA